ncbi:MAG TPA: glycoside hydrolase family 130 protein [Gemmatimonadales bacterium]|nr:glycoside hydrolase family 130 protein [Gemmatimonadales bacterium]
MYVRGLVATALALVALSAAREQHQWMVGPFIKPAVNPIIVPDSSSHFDSPMNGLVAWEAYATFNPAAIVRGGRIFLLYRAEDASGRQEIGGHTSRLGLAESSDGLHFRRRPTPVLYPDTDAQRANEWPGGVEDPRVVESEDGTYILTYTQWNRDVPRLAVATSRDLVSWVKHGPAFAHAAGGKYLRNESKSGAILARVEAGKTIATRVNGKYWMYWGVPTIRFATSSDLLDWTPVEDSAGRAVAALTPRPAGFDSWLVEAGPPPLLTPAGIVVLYNAGDSATRSYSAGQALFDRTNPLRLIARSDTAFIKPTEPYERTGQYAAGTTFVEALVPFQGKWFLYYGTADSRVGVAVWNPKAR